MDDEAIGADRREHGYHVTRAVLLIVDNPAHGIDAVDSIALARLRIAGRIDWARATELLIKQAPHDVMLVEAQGVATDLLVAVLPLIGALARSEASQVVVALDIDQIDLVAAYLPGNHVQLLCAPGLVDRITALTLAVAAGDGSRLHDRSRDEDATRSRRLNEEVARVAESLARLARRESEAAPPERPAGLPGTPSPTVESQSVRYSDEVDPHWVRQAIRTRRLRDQFFDRGLLEDPAWDMLLDLFAAELEGRQVSISSLCIAAAVAPTTALRWISKMTEVGLFERLPDPTDRRRAFMTLSPRASEGMRGYMIAAMRAGLDIA